MMVDINDQELLVGDNVLIAFSSCGDAYLEYAVITAMDNAYIFKIRFTSNKYFHGKTKTVHLYNSKMLKVWMMI